MIYRTIQGSRVPALGFGTYQITGPSCRNAVADALNIGYRHIDTAQIYRNEAEVGEAISGSGIPREDIFLTTKVWLDNLAPADVHSSTRESLRKLQTDYVDLLLIHWPNESAAPLEETLDALDELKNAGHTRHIGVSNFTPSMVERAVNHTTIFCNQVEYHPLLAQETLLKLAREHGMLLTAYSPIARGKVLESSTLQQIGSTHGKSPVQVALRWLLQQENVAAIPKAESADHRRSNFDVFDFELSDEEMQRIDQMQAGKRLVNPGFAPAWEK